MNEIKVSPDLILCYAKMDKNEVTLHMAIKALAEEGKLKRNICQMCRILGKQQIRLYESEFKLKRKKLLQVHYTRNGTRDVPYWYVFDRPVGEEAIPLPASVKTNEAPEEPKQKSIWRKLRDAIVGTGLDNFDLTDSQ